MKIKKIEDKNIWDKIIQKINKNTFLHSSSWGDFNQNEGHSSFRYLMLKDTFEIEKINSFSDSEEEFNQIYDNVISACHILKIEAKRGTFLFCPHGPQSENLTQEILNNWVVFLKQKAKDEKCDFIRISPIEVENQESTNLFQNAGFRKSPIHMHAELSTVVDLNPTEKEILLNMRKTTRQMIKKGIKMVEKGEVKIEWVDSLDDELMEVYHSTTQRGGFVPFSRDFLNEEFESFNKNGNAKMAKVVYEDKVYSWGMYIFNGKRAFYHQGANILHKKVPASYLTHWTGITLAKERGCESYDFWGVGPKDDKNHPWANISIFKRGFGGDDVKLIPAQDVPITFKYWFTWIIETIRAKKRGF